MVVNPTATTTYTLTAMGNRTQATAQVTVTVTTTGPPPPPPPPPPDGQTPVANAGSDFDALNREVRLNGTASTDPQGLPLTYRWTAVDRTAAVVEPNSPTPRVILGELFGVYIFELTVTNSAGLSSTSTVRVRLISTRIF
jgi:hypothetical protein